MIGVLGYFANPCKWVHIGCKIGYNLRNLEKDGCNKINRLWYSFKYDVFCKSAEDWPVARISKEKIDADFKNYLGRNAVPPYVNHFVRQNKHHIDEIHLPRI